MIPVTGLHSVCVVVRDLEAAARAHSLVYGIERWAVAAGAATGSNPHGVAFRLVQPDGGGTFAEFLAARGEGIHSLRLTGPTNSHIDTPEALGGYSLEVVEPGMEEPPAERTWVFEDAGGPPVDITRIWHIGVAVRDLRARLPAYERLLGVSGWNLVHLRPEGATLDGHPVENAFQLARATVAGLEVELIQPTLEPTHYRRELLDRVGDGVHHVLAWPALDEARWQETRRWMEAHGAQVAMSGRVRSGAAEFFYLDTRRLLGGYLLEAIRRRD